MSFYRLPEVDLSIAGTPKKGLTLLLPYNGFAENFKKLGIHFIKPEREAQLANARLPKNWTVTVISTDYEKIFYLYDNNSSLKAKFIFGKFIDVDFPD